MFRPQPIRGATVMYGVSRRAAERENQRELDRQRQMEYEVFQQTDELQRQHRGRRRLVELEALKAKETEGQRVETSQQASQPPRHGSSSTATSPDVLFCDQCGLRCRMTDRVCCRCGNNIGAGKGER